MTQKKEQRQVCYICELPPEDGKFIYKEWIGEPVYMSCYLNLVGDNPNAMVDFCQRCGSDDTVKYYPIAKQSLCQNCAQGIPRTTLS